MRVRGCEGSRVRSASLLLTAYPRTRVPAYPTS